MSCVDVLTFSVAAVFHLHWLPWQETALKSASAAVSGESAAPVVAKEERCVLLRGRFLVGYCLIKRDTSGWLR